ncbi:MAG: hypothetical protein J0M04_12930 [Verrucomicrobia bacterium]|nr:hypothetical protein [Verrucomicrobiota bacterium]
MKIDQNNLPPMWVKIFSGIFLFFLVTPLFAVWQIRNTGYQHWITAFGLNLESGRVSLVWMLALDVILFSGALTGLFILTKRAFAYGFGVFYCISAIVVSVLAHLSVGTRDEISWQNISVQYPLLICFLIHLVRNRSRWTKMNANKARLEQPAISDSIS